jgi:hypothetical protein
MHHTFSQDSLSTIGFWEGRSVVSKWRKERTADNGDMLRRRDDDPQNLKRAEFWKVSVSLWVSIGWQIKINIGVTEATAIECVLSQRINWNTVKKTPEFCEGEK